jgi:Reverse transcriptase (RNA-dependent DNA polymerase)
MKASRYWRTVFPFATETSIATTGIRLQLVESAPRRFHQRALNLNATDAAIVNTQLAELASKNLIEKARRPQWVSPPFVVHQQNGKARLCFDMSRLGRHLPPLHFKMEGLADARALSTPKTWYAKIDLKDAYHAIGVHPSARPLLAFPWKGEIWQWTRLPFGLSLAPLFFTRVIKKALSLARRDGHQFVQYLDDILILGDSPEEVTRTVTRLIQDLQSAGFQVNTSKSEFTPTRSITFLGMTLNTETNALVVPRDRVRKCRREALTLAQATTTSPRKLSAVLGLLNSISAAVAPGLLQQRWCQRDLRDALRTTPWDEAFTLSHRARSELLWWAHELPHYNGRPLPLSLPRASWALATDASETGWGIVTPTRTFSGHWTPAQA